MLIYLIFILFLIADESRAEDIEISQRVLKLYATRPDIFPPSVSMLGKLRNAAKEFGIKSKAIVRMNDSLSNSTDITTTTDIDEQELSAITVDESATDEKATNIDHDINSIYSIYDDSIYDEITDNVKQESVVADVLNHSDESNDLGDSKDQESGKNSTKEAIEDTDQPKDGHHAEAKELS